MSDFNPLDRAKVAVHRSSFDLSSKKLFTAKVGEILPVYYLFFLSRSNVCFTDIVPGVRLSVFFETFETLLQSTSVFR